MKMLRSWKKVKKSGNFRRKILNGQEQILQRARELTEEFKSRRVVNNYQQAAIVGTVLVKNEMCVKTLSTSSNHHQASANIIPENSSPIPGMCFVVYLVFSQSTIL